MVNPAKISTHADPIIFGNVFNNQIVFLSSILQKFTKAKALLEIPLQTDTWILHAVILKIVSLYHLSLSAAWAGIGTLWPTPSQMSTFNF